MTRATDQKMAADPLRLLTRRDLAELLGRSERYIEKQEAAGTFPIPRVAGLGVRYSRFDYERYISGGHLGAKPRSGRKGGRA